MSISICFAPLGWRSSKDEKSNERTVFESGILATGVQPTKVHRADTTSTILMAHVRYKFEN